ncbi:MAG: hypothetical protein M3Y21_07330 [Candidatus Eremiobacteraeota bacterium]|nr:hypothetical protein [Candidatus Eremiobacteraeota bacterium]
MSVRTEPSRLPTSLSADASALLAGGWSALLTVLAAGLTLGFFGWYFLIVPLHRPLLSALGLPLGVVFGAAVILWCWTSYAHYFSRRAGIKYDRALQYDAISWIAFLLLWFSFVAPLTLTHGTRTLVVSLALFVLVKLIVAARFNQTVREVSIDFVVTRIAIIVIAELAGVIIGQRAGTHISESRHLLLSVWGHWDAVHYIDIATIGYHGTDLAFFPLYPFLISLLGGLTANHLIAGLIISNVAFFFGLLFLYKLVEHEFDRSVARRAIFYISIFPTAVFFSAVYTESLFFMLTVASFYYVRERKWWLAGLFGLFAAMTRVEGVLLAVPFAIEWYGAYKDTPAKGFLNLIGGALIPLGLAIYMGYLWVLNGDPLYFSHVQAHWNRHLAPPWVSIGHAFHLLATSQLPQTIANQGLEIAFTAFMIGVLIIGWRRLRPAYIAYLGLSVLVPMSTSSLMSMPRFALVLFPIFVLLGLWGKRPSVNNLIVAFSLPLLGLYTVLFADWYWVA